jgi:Fibrobacter succinogenes major domain (Fib_succ_major)
MKHLAYIILCFVMLCNVHLVNAQGDVKIGKQTWMSKNLDVSTFRNGEQIPQAKDVEQWQYAGTNKIPAWCYYEFNESNGKKYGKLYNWFAVSDSRGLAPNGYHIPSDAEWDILTDFLGGADIAGKKMKSKDGWKSYEEGGKKTCPDCADWTQSYREQVPCHICKNSRYVKTPIVTLSGNGDNSSGFNVLPGGNCYDNGNFYNITEDGGFWSSSENNTRDAWYRNLSLNNTRVGRYYFNKYGGLSVRCLRD